MPCFGTAVAMLSSVAQFFTSDLLMNLENQIVHKRLHIFLFVCGFIVVQMCPGGPHASYFCCKIVTEFGHTRHQKVHFLTFDGRLEFQCIRHGPRHPTCCSGSPQNTFVTFSLMFQDHIFPKRFYEIGKCNCFPTSFPKFVFPGSLKRYVRGPGLRPLPAIFSSLWNTIGDCILKPICP